MDPAIVAANRALLARGYSADEIRVDPAPDLGPAHGRLCGSLVENVEADSAAMLLRLVTLLPDRDVLLAARDGRGSSAD